MAARSAVGIILGLATCLGLAVSCAPPQPTATPTPTPTPLPPTATPSPTATAGGPQVIEGLLMKMDGQWVVGVDWTSRSRITVVVQGAAEGALEPLLGETVRVEGIVTEQNPWKKEIALQKVGASTAPERLSLRSGLVKELGISIYMQGTHRLVDERGQLICLLSGSQNGIDLNQAMGQGRVNVYGVLSPTVEGNAQIMEVELVEPIQ